MRRDPRVEQDELLFVLRRADEEAAELLLLAQSVVVAQEVVQLSQHVGEGLQLRDCVERVAARLQALQVAKQRQEDVQPLAQLAGARLVHARLVQLLVYRKSQLHNAGNVAKAHSSRHDL